MESLYQQLLYRHAGPESSWIGNLRWFALEEGEGSWSFHSAPMDRDHSRNSFQAVRDHFTLTLCSPGPAGDYLYGADRITARFSRAAAELVFPMHDYGAVIRLTGPGSQCRIVFPRQTEAVPVSHGLLLRDQGYFLCFLSENSIFREGETLSIAGEGLLSIGFSNCREAAEQAARSLLENSSLAEQRSRLAWEEYLASCPIHVTGNPETDTRQLWHWWCALQNLSLVDFNSCRCYLAPDKCNWFGSWSNDSPEVLAALSLTAAAHLARQGIIDYIRCAISPEGIQGWYTHADGRSSHGIPGDPGSHSQGVACIAHTVDYYVRATGDASILRADVGGCSLWEKLKHFLCTFLDTRDLNKDGLIDCANIWESGWDDRLCPFFEKKDLEQWVQVITQGTEEEIRDFYEAWQMPVTVMAEQVYTLWALKAMAHLARILQETDTESFCRRAFDTMLTGVRQRLWNPEDGFYHDLDLNRNALSDSFNLDAFYFLYFEKDPQRIAEMVEKLKDPRKFSLPYLPTTSADHPGFRETGYWCGGHWPREMSYVGLALWEAGQQELARHYVCRALMTGEGNLLYENVNSLTGQPQTRPRRMAYDVLLMAALAHMDGKLSWTED